MRNIINAAPQCVVLNTADSSTRDLSRIPEELAQHIPKIYTYAKRGPLGEQLIDSDTRTQMYGEETFDLRSTYATHQTVLANIMAKQANPVMMKRIVPEDAGPKSNLTLWLDVLETSVDLYTRDEYGNIKYDPTSGDPTVTGNTTGYKVKWVVSNEADSTSFNSIGSRTPITGDQADGTNQSMRYPIMEFVVADQGGYGNNLGVRIWPYGGDTRSIPTSLMVEKRVYPFFLNIIERDDSRSNPSVVTTIFNERDVTFTFKPNTVDPDTNMNMYVGNVIDNQYTNTKTAGFPPVYGEFGEVYIYDTYVKDLVDGFHTAEIPYIDSNHDFSDEVEDSHLFNLVGGYNSNGSPYHSYQFADDVGSIRLTEYTQIFCGGGSDGTLSYEDTPYEDPADPTNTLIHKGFNSLVKDELERYADIDDPLMEMAVNVESTIWDTGFPLEVKEAFSSVIMHRPDTYVVLGTHQHGNRVFTMAEEQSIGMALRTRLEMQPESDYFGTPVLRAAIMEGTGKFRNIEWPHRVSIIFDFAEKVAAYMGSNTGRWVSEKAFDDPDAGDNRIVKSLYDISTPYMSSLTRARRWDIGLNWVQPDNRQEYFYPAVRTAYSDDTSVLTSFVNMAAVCFLNKITQSAWRRFTGNSKLSKQEMIEKVNAFVIERTSGIFDERFNIIPDTQFTSADEVRGYSWHLPIKFYANNMLTVQTTYIRAFRMSDLDQ